MSSPHPPLPWFSNGPNHYQASGQPTPEYLIYNQTNQLEYLHQGPQEDPYPSFLSMETHHWQPSYEAVPRLPNQMPPAAAQQERMSLTAPLLPNLPSNMLYANLRHDVEQPWEQATVHNMQEAQAFEGEIAPVSTSSDFYIGNGYTLRGQQGTQPISQNLDNQARDHQQFSPSSEPQLNQVHNSSRVILNYSEKAVQAPAPVDQGAESNDGGVSLYNSSTSSCQSSSNHSMGSSDGSRSLQYGTEASSEASVPQPQTTPPVQGYLFEQWIPGGGLRMLSEILKTQPWLLRNQPEPPLTATENLPYDSKSRKKISSRFDLFFDPENTHRCRWFEEGRRCTNTTVRKEHAQAHARYHFNYTPFICGGKCGTVGCHQKYRCPSRLAQHIQITKRPQRYCDTCRKTVLAQNYARHKGIHTGTRAVKSTASN